MWQRPEHLDNQFRFCCILHNRIHKYFGQGDVANSDATWLLEEIEEGFEGSDLLDIEARVRLEPGQGRSYDVSRVGAAGGGSGLALDTVCEWEPAFDALRLRLVTHFAMVSNPFASAGVRCHWLR